MDTRKYDLEILYKSRKAARNAFERDMADKAYYKILRETNVVKGKREKLISAFRNGDLKAVKRFENELMMLKADETYGKEY